ncbi:MAG: hypothetical protein JWN37_396 [Candidatus Nomurabacteria bacterium]|nr:hypothetical protein [Candidatus Nomurabacteria bacterium]
MNENTKNYTNIIIGIVIVLIIILGGVLIARRNSAANPVSNTNSNTVDTAGMQTYTGEITRTFEGDHTLKYSFLIPETATSTVSMNNALVKITDNKTSYATVYISYEGGRGYSPVDYIDKLIIPKVASKVTITGSSTDNATVAQSAGSEWHVIPAGNGEWLIVIESPKTASAQIQKMIDSFKAE